MNNLRELIGENVIAPIGEDEQGDDIYIDCKVIDVDINDYYFYDKDEPIYITVNVAPVDEMPFDFDYECLRDIPLGYIRKSYKGVEKDKNGVTQ